MLYGTTPREHQGSCPRGRRAAARRGLLTPRARWQAVGNLSASAAQQNVSLPPEEAAGLWAQAPGTLVFTPPPPVLTRHVLSLLPY